MILLMMKMILNLIKVTSDRRPNLHKKITLKKIYKLNNNKKRKFKSRKNNNQNKLISRKKVELLIKIKLSNFMKMILKTALVKRKKTKIKYLKLSFKIESSFTTNKI